MLSVLFSAVAALTIPSIAIAAGEFEPNDSLLTSAGPMSGGVNYNATIETNNDADWYRFYTRGVTQLDITMTGLTSDRSGCAEIGLYDSNGNGISSDVSGEFDRISHIYETVGVGVFYLQGDPDFCAGGPTNRYRFSINPAGAITANEVCGQAFIGQREAYRTIKRAKKRLAKVRKRSKRRQLRTEIRAGKASLAQAQSILIQGC